MPSASLLAALFCAALSVAGAVAALLLWRAERRDHGAERSNAAAAAQALARVDAELGAERARRGDLQREADGLRAERDALRAAAEELRVERARLAAALEHAGAGQSAMAATFRAASAEVVGELMAGLAQRAAEQQLQHSDAAHQRIAAQVQPISDALDRFQRQVAAMEQARAGDQGGLRQGIDALLQASAATQEEARRLSGALRRGAGVQGRWGEETLRNVLAHAGLAARFDYEEQLSLDTAEGRRRPDAVVHLPGGGVFVIDAKCSLTAFLEAQEAAEERARAPALARHAASMRAHLLNLSAKEYWSQFAERPTPDFVAMFVPGDGFLAAALEHAPDLLSEAMDRRVIIVTPTTLFALCKAVAYGWRVDEQSRNADEVVRLGRELHKRIAVMGGHLDAVGRSLGAAVGKYNAFVGSLESQVMTQARRFEGLKVDHEARPIPELQPIEAGVRPLGKLSPAEPAA